MKRMILGLGLLLPLADAGSAWTQVPAGSPEAQPSLPADPAIAQALAGIDPAKIQADIAKLVSFGTRSTLSSMETSLPPGQGINAAADWVESEFQAISAACGGCLQVKRDSFVEPASTTVNGRFPRPTKLVNIYAIFAGTSENKAAPWVLVTGHYDSCWTPR
jgi:acetylornithine deacetylase/succinyl-diaminopimelate desuccinylase-like protein